MRIWLALIVAPLLALTDLTVSYASVGFACAHQAPLSVHFVHLAFLAGAAACTFGALRAWRQDASPNEATAQTHFLAGVAMAAAALSTVTIAAMWMPTWVVSSCLG
jgi:hypothetical protein